MYVWLGWICAALLWLLAVFELLRRRKVPAVTTSSDQPSTPQARDSAAAHLVGELHVLSAPGEVALATEAEWVDRSGELAMNFDAALTGFRHFWGDRVPENLRDALAAVEAAFDRLQETGDSSSWEDEAVCTHPAWAEIRDLAARALRVLLDTPRT